MMKVLAIYSIIALSGFSIYSIYFAMAGDNSPFWIAIAIACLPVIAFALFYLIRKH
jgi:heme exporter protein D